MGWVKDTRRPTPGRAASFVRAPAKALRLLLCVAVAALAFVVATGSRERVGRASEPSPKTPAALAAAAPPRAVSKRSAPDSAKPADHVAVGLYLHHVMQVDLRANSFLADLYVWFRWKGDVDPTKSFEFRNAVEQWQIVKAPAYVDESGEAAPITLEDGTKYQVFRVEVRLGRPFSVQHYPLDEQDLVIEVEEAKYLASELVYDLDRGDTGFDPRIEIPGWVVVGENAEVGEATFSTNFGDPRVSGGERYSRLRMQVHIVRPTRGMIVKTIAPLVIVILITFGVFFLEPHSVDARLTMSVTALISAVALELSSATELPEVGYLVLLDKVYILSYVVILFTVANSIFVARYAERESLERARRLDNLAGLALTLAFFGGTAAILIWR